MTRGGGIQCNRLYYSPANSVCELNNAETVEIKPLVVDKGKDESQTVINLLKAPH